VVGRVQANWREKVRGLVSQCVSELSSEKRRRGRTCRDEGKQKLEKFGERPAGTIYWVLGIKTRPALPQA